MTVKMMHYAFILLAKLGYAFSQKDSALNTVLSKHDSQHGTLAPRLYSMGHTAAGPDKCEG